MARIAVIKQDAPGRPPAAASIPTALDAANDHVFENGADAVYFEIVNSDGANSVTVEAVRVACPTCGASAEPSGKGMVTAAPGETKLLGPLPAALYGQGDAGRDIHLNVSGTGTGTIRALKA